MPLRELVPAIGLALQAVSLPAGALAQVESVPPVDMTPRADIVPRAQQAPLLSGHWASDVLAGGLVGHRSARWLSRRRGVKVSPPASLDGPSAAWVL